MIKTKDTSQVKNKINISSTGNLSRKGSDKAKKIDEERKAKELPSLSNILSQSERSRDENIAQARNAKYTLQSIGDYYGLTRERVRQICNAMNSRRCINIVNISEVTSSYKQIIDVCDKKALTKEVKRNNLTDGMKELLRGNGDINTTPTTYKGLVSRGLLTQIIDDKCMLTESGMRISAYLCMEDV